MPAKLADYCVYTIVHGNKLEEEAEKGDEAKFTGRTKWITGLKLWKAAQKAGLGMPVLFGDATDCSDLMCWGLLTSLEVSDTGTKYTVDKIRMLPHCYTPQELVLKSTGKKIAERFIRPYAICETPDFICESDERVISIF